MFKSDPTYTTYTHTHDPTYTHIPHTHMTTDGVDASEYINNPDYMVADLKLAVPNGVRVDSGDLLIGGPMMAGSVGKGIIGKVFGSRWFRANIFSYSSKTGSTAVTIGGKLKYISRINPSNYQGKTYTKSIKWGETHLIDW